MPLSPWTSDKQSPLRTAIHTSCCTQRYRNSCPASHNLDDEITSPSTIRSTRSSGRRSKFQVCQHNPSCVKVKGSNVCMSKRLLWLQRDACKGCKDPRPDWSSFLWWRLEDRATRISSSNLGRVKQEGAIGVDGMDPQVKGRVASGDRGHGAGPARCSQHRRGKKSK